MWRLAVVEFPDWLKYPIRAPLLIKGEIDDVKLACQLPVRSAEGADIALTVIVAICAPPNCAVIVTTVVVALDAVVT